MFCIFMGKLPTLFSTRLMLVNNFLATADQKHLNSICHISRDFHALVIASFMTYRPDARKWSKMTASVARSTCSWSSPELQPLRQLHKLYRLWNMISKMDKSKTI